MAHGMHSVKLGAKNMADPAEQEHVCTFPHPMGRESIGVGSTEGCQIPKCGAHSVRKAIAIS